MHLQLLVDVLQMKVDRGGRDAEFGRRGFVVVTFDQQLQNPRLVRREVIIGAVRRSNIAKQTNDAPRHFRRHRRAALRRFFHTLHQLPGLGLLQQVT